MCGIIYNTYRGCGHRLDPGEVEPCEDGIVSDKVCKGADGKPPGEPFEQTVHTLCPPCEKEQKELDEDLDTPIGSWISDQRSRASKKDAKPASQQHAGHEQASAASSRRSRGTVSTAASRATARQTVAQAQSELSSQATTAMSAKKAGKQPVYQQQQSTPDGESSVASSSHISSAASTATSRSSSTATLSQARPERMRSNASRRSSHAATVLSAVQEQDGDSGVSRDPRAQQLPQRNASRSRASSRSGATRRQVKSAVSSDYASTVRQERFPQGKAPSQASTAQSSTSKQSSRVQTDLSPTNNVSQDRSRSQANQRLQDARKDLHNRLSAQKPPSEKSSFRSLVTSLLKGGKASEAKSLTDLSDIQEKTEHSGSMASGASEQRDVQAGAQARGRADEPSYIHPDDHPSQFPPSARMHRPRRKHSVVGEQETDEQRSARLIAVEKARAEQLDRDIAIARDELREAEDAAFEHDTRQAIENSQALSPHEEWQEKNMMREAMHASLQHQRDSIRPPGGRAAGRVQVVFDKCKHRVWKDAALYTDAGGQTPRFVHRPGWCDECQIREQRQQPQASAASSSRAGPSARQEANEVESSQAASSRPASRREQRTRYQPTESPTMTSSERGEIRPRPPPSFASSRRRGAISAQGGSIAPSMGVPASIAYRSRDREEASRQRLFAKKNKEYEEYKKRHGDGESSNEELEDE